MKFPIKDIQSIGQIQFVILHYIIDHDTKETLLDCPCINLSDIYENDTTGIGSQYCKNMCEYKMGYDEDNQTVSCSHKYWIKQLMKEYYKEHG